MDKADLYWQSRLRDLERRIEYLEAEVRALTVNPMSKSDCYSVNQFAEAMDVSRQTIIRMIKRGDISAVKVGRNWKIPKTELKLIYDQD